MNVCNNRLEGWDSQRQGKASPTSGKVEVQAGTLKETGTRGKVGLCHLCRSVSRLFFQSCSRCDLNNEQVVFAKKSSGRKSSRVRSSKAPRTPRNLDKVKLSCCKAEAAGEQASQVLERCEGWTQELLPLLLLSKVESYSKVESSSNANQGVERQDL